MSNKTILLEKQNHVLTITLNRPEQRNAFVNDMIYESAAALDDANQDPDVRAIVLTGSGKSFCSGADVVAFKNAYEEFKRTGKHTSALDQEALERWAMAMRYHRKPVIAALNGAAVGLGFTLAVACDIRIASEKAQMGAIFLRVGLTPEFGSSYNLTRLIGIAKSCELVFTGKIIGAAEALEIGLVNQVVPSEELMPTTMQMAQTIAGFSAEAVSISKANLYNGMDAAFSVQTKVETLANMVTRQTKDHGEGIAAFLEKRQPNFNQK